MTDARPVLQVEGFGIAFGDKVVLADVGFALPERGCTVLLGPSGTGKSTLLRTMPGPKWRITCVSVRSAAALAREAGLERRRAAFAGARGAWRRANLAGTGPTQRGA